MAFDLLYLGFALIFPNLLMIVMAVLALFLFDCRFAEENYLITVFGERYRDYQSGEKIFVMQNLQCISIESIIFNRFHFR